MVMDRTEKTPGLSLDARLACAASLVRDGAVVADIGTDHAYLPVSLLLKNRIEFAVASDINAGPLDRAEKNAAKYGVKDRMAFALCDGIPESCAGYGVTDIVICGMGGELIASIIAASSYTRAEGVNLVLQPMSCPDELRKYLCAYGYDITDERLSRAAGKLYTCMKVRYDGIARTMSPAELLLGRMNIMNREELFVPFAQGYAKKLRIRIDGLTAGGLESEAQSERECLEEIEGLLKE